MVSGEDHFWSNIPCLRWVQCGLFASNVTQVAVISGWKGPYGSVRPMGHVRHLAFGDRGHGKCAMGPKQSLKGVLFGLKSPCLRGLSGTFLSSNVTQVAVISGLNDLHESMGSVGHAGHLALAMGSMPSPQWVPNGGWRWSFLTGKISMSEGDPVAIFSIHSHSGDCFLRL